MAYKNYVNKFYSQRGNRWDIEIWSKSDSSLSSVEFSTGKGGFKLSYKGGDDRQDITMPSEVTIPFIVSNADDESFINGFLTADDKEYLVVIKRNLVVFWWGNLNAGFDTKQDISYPFIVTLKGNDFTGELINKKDLTSISNNSVTSIGTDTLEFFTNVSDIGTWASDVFPRGAAELFLRTNMAWTANNQYATSDIYNPFLIFKFNQQGFESNSNSVGFYKKSDAYKQILKCFGLKMFLADGKLYCIQPYNYINNTTSLNITAPGGELSLTQTYLDLDNRQNVNNNPTSATDVDDGFNHSQWITEVSDFTNSSQNWQANGSCTSITTNKFNIAVTTSNLFIDLAEGEYCLNYSEDDDSAYIALEQGGVVTTLLEYSGHKNFSVGAGGAELRIYSSIVGDVTVDNIAVQKGNFAHRTFLGGTSFNYDRPISIATATFPFGQSFARAVSNFPNPDDTNTTDSVYTSLTSIGAVNATNAENLLIRFNVFFGERFDYNASNAVSHVGGEITMKLKIGSNYLNGFPGNFSWSTSSSTFKLIIPIEELVGNYTDNFWQETTEVFCQSYNPQLGDNYYFGIPGSAGSTGFIGGNFLQNLPTLTAGGGVSLQFVSGTINYYLNPDTSNPNVDPTPLTLTKANYQSKFFTGSKYNYDDPGAPIHFEIITSNQNDSINGIDFSASTGLDNYKLVDFGNIELGLAGDETTHINSIQVLDSSFENVVPTYMQVNATGTQYNHMTTLLLEQYIEPQIEPLEILQGSYYVNDFSAFKSLVLGSNKYVFYEGTLNAEEDIVSGSWYKMAASTETITNSEEDIIYIEDDTPTPPPPPNPHDPPLEPYHITEGITKGKEWIKYNSIGLSGTAIASADTKVDLMNNSRAKLYTGQKLIFSKPDLSHPIILTKSGDSTTSDTQIDVASFTPDVTYPAGSILAIVEFDLTNVITGGGTPGGSDTQVQFNNSGAFGGTDLLKVTGANELTIGGTNTNTKLNAGADIILGADVAGGTSSTIQYLDSGSTARVMLGAYATDIVVLSNRAANGIVEIRANTSSAGSAGELTIATYKDTSVDFLADAELRGTNIGNIFDLAAYLTAVDFCMTSSGSNAGFSGTDGASSEVSSSSISQFATFQVPIGYEATHVQVNGSSSLSVFDVYACDVANATATALTSSPAVNTDQALSSAQSGTAGKYLSIRYKPGATRRSIYGAKITLARV